MTEIVVRSPSGHLPSLVLDDMADHFDDGALERGCAYAATGRVRSLVWNESQTVLIGKVSGAQTQPYSVLAQFEPTRTRGADSGAEPEFGLVGTICTCPVGDACKHGVALLQTFDDAAMGHGLVVAPRKDGAPGGSGRSTPVRGAWAGRVDVERDGARSVASPETGWRRALSRFTSGAAGGGRPHAAQARRLGIQFALSAQTRSHHGYPIWESVNEIAPGLKWAPTVRVVEEGARPGSWRKGSLRWSSFLHPQSLPYPRHQSILMAQLYRLSGTADTGPYGFGDSTSLRLDAFPGSLFWEVLHRLREAGVAFIATGAIGGVVLGRAAAASVDLSDAGEEGLRLTGGVRIDGEPVDDVHIVGDHGVAALVEGALVDGEDSPSGSTGTAGGKPSLILAPSMCPFDGAARDALTSPVRIVVPREDVEEFLQEYVPGLGRIVEVGSADGTVTVPEPRPPRLRLQLAYGAGDSMALAWSWDLVELDRDVPITTTGALPDHPALEAAVLESVRRVWPGIGTVATERLRGVEAARFAVRVLPELEAMESVRVEVSGTVREYRELDGGTEIRLTVATGQQDWFDLDFEVAVAGQEIPFSMLFTALVGNEEWLLLPDGDLLSLARPEFDTLRELIAEGRAVADWDAGSTQVSRMQLGMIDDLSALADAVDAPPEWTAGVVHLRALDAFEPPQAPSGLKAELRDYQRDGFAWLSMLYDAGLGGILADDMGLGKTVQTLALFAYARERANTARGAAVEGAASQGPAPAAPRPATPAPFLVIAPSSVIGVWLQEAQRFTPGLSVRALTSTARRRGTTVARESAGADVVVTSYAVARLDAEQFAQSAWTGIVLDEAQFVKNPVAKVNRAIATIRAPFRLAITGTPMENSLTDLWSLLSLTAGGLFPSAAMFAERFVKVIERGSEGKEIAADRMELLRRRVRPFMLRRTKEQVASALPPKQVQVAHVKLSSAHRRLYDSVLQKERMKVMGLLEEGMEGNRFAVLRSLTLLRMLALDPSLVDAEYTDVKGSKLSMLMENLAPVLEGGSKVLVFSQFTSFLDRVEDRLESKGTTYARLDGATRDRDAAIREFREGTAQVFLISLKAGGFGLTLTEADYVFLLDPWWNPAAEAQAVDRAHRIGQDKTVMVYRLVAEGTIEEKMLALQQRKAQLFSRLMDDGEDLAFSQTLTANDVRELLGDT